MVMTKSRYDGHGQIRHMGQSELKEALDSHNNAFKRCGTRCECVECLYNRWYWLQQYRLPYPQLPEWSQHASA